MEIHLRIVLWWDELHTHLPTPESSPYHSDNSVHSGVRSQQTLLSASFSNSFFFFLLNLDNIYPGSSHLENNKMERKYKLGALKRQERDSRRSVVASCRVILSHHTSHYLIERTWPVQHHRCQSAAAVCGVEIFLLDWQTVFIVRHYKLIQNVDFSLYFIWHTGLLWHIITYAFIRYFTVFFTVLILKLLGGRGPCDEAPPPLYWDSSSAPGVFKSLRLGERIQKAQFSVSECAVLVWTQCQGCMKRGAGGNFPSASIN